MLSLLFCSVSLLVSGDVKWRFWNPPEIGRLTANIAMVSGAERKDTLAMIRELERANKNVREGRGVNLSGLARGPRTTYEFSTSNPLWRASLETIDFMPLATVDYSGGIIITDWYSDETNSNESIKITIRFLTNEIRSDALDINVFLKKCSENLTNCSISKNNNDLIADLNLSILKKATKYQKEIIERCNGYLL